MIGESTVPVPIYCNVQSAVSFVVAHCMLCMLLFLSIVFVSWIPTAKQVDFMQEKFHIFMLRSGRINMCGLTPRNIDHVAKAIDSAVRLSTEINGRL